MDEKLSYEEFQGYMSNFNFRQLKDNYKFEFIVPKVNEFIVQEEIKVFYPRNLFVEDKDTELLFFTEDKVYLVTGEDDQEGKINIGVLYLKNIVDYNFEIESASGYENVKLFIRFSNDRTIELNAHDETNSSWRNGYANKVKQIIKLL